MKSIALPKNYSIKQIHITLALLFISLFILFICDASFKVQFVEKKIAFRKCSNKRRIFFPVSKQQYEIRNKSEFDFI